MAVATLTATPAQARPALAAGAPPLPVFLALDLGTTTGWALRTACGQITSGTASFRPGRFDGGGMRYLRFANCLGNLELARLTMNPGHLDSLVGVAGYAACVREVRS